MTDQPKWTPGPWIWSGGTGVQRPNGRWVHVETTAPHKQAVANARLIAAAPDLYAALDDLLASYAEPDQQICCGGHGCGCRGASVRDLAEHHARAALAKARGEA